MFSPAQAFFIALLIVLFASVVGLVTAYYVQRYMERHRKRTAIEEWDEAFWSNE